MDFQFDATADGRRLKFLDTELLATVAEAKGFVDRVRQVQHDHPAHCFWTNKKAKVAQVT